jgi:hypothetical protein
MIRVCQLPDIDLPALRFFITRRLVTHKKMAINVRLGLLLFCARVFVFVCVCMCMSVSVSVSLPQALNQVSDSFKT